MKHLYYTQTLLVVVCSLLSLSWANAQISQPLTVFVKNSGATFSDQFPASTNFAFTIVDPVSPALGSAGIAAGTEPNTVRVSFTPQAGVTGTTDLIVSYFTTSTPMLPKTKSYRFVIGDEVVYANTDRYLIDSGALEVPLAVLANDSTTSQNLTLSRISVVNSGSASINTSDNTILFTPDADFSGDTWIQYIACDDAGNCGEGKAHLLVRDVNDQNVKIYRKSLLNQQTLDIVTPFEDYSVQIPAKYGTLEMIDSISWSYTPDAGFTGKDTFELALQDLINRTYYITVYEKVVNVQAKDDRFYVRPGLSVSFNVLNNDLLNFDLISHTNPSKGSMNDLGNGQFTYSPNTGYRGVDKFTYTVCFQDTVYCETATVLLHVTDLEPENVFTYQLQTSQDLPLTIDYAIDYTDYSYIISDQPDHGVFNFYEGVQEIYLPCDTVEKYHYLEYIPNPGYTGPDYFEYYYCVVPSNVCYLVKVNVNVIASPEPESCPCVVDCVWPGDSDKDGRVDMADLLNLAHHIGAVGPARNYATPDAWFGQHSAIWNSPENSIGLQYLDGNGDGVLTTEDVAVISDHYFRTDDIVTRDVQQKLPYQFSMIPVQFSLDSGDLVILDISLGNGNVPVLDMKGTKFSINVPPIMMDSATVEVSFHQNSWLAESSPNISLGKVPVDGRIDAGFAKSNGASSSGYGIIATVVFIIEDDAEGIKSDDDEILVPVTLTGGTVMGLDGTLYEVEGDEVTLKLNLNHTKSPQYDLIVYPNPAQDAVNVHINGKTALSSISIIDPQGRMIKTIDGLTTKQHQLDVSALPVGLYYMQVHHEHGMMTQVLSVIR